MKSVTAESGNALAPSGGGLVGDLAELVKARLTLLVLLTTAVGFYLGTKGPLAWLALWHAVFGTAMAAAGAAALNQWWERALDALMHRTRERPIPAGRMAPQHGLFVGSVLSAAGVAYLAVLGNGLSAILAAATIAIYVLAYTPLKRVSTANTLVGAVPGALPPLVGWAAATGNVALPAWSLFAILFCWQMPHFFALAWMYREDYARGGFQMLSRGDDTAVRSASQAVLFSMLLLILTGLPFYLGVATQLYLPFAFVLGIWFTYKAMRFHKRRDLPSARGLFLASIIYLPLLLLVLVLTKA